MPDAVEAANHLIKGKLWQKLLFLPSQLAFASVFVAKLMLHSSAFDLGYGSHPESIEEYDIV
jgi:hypothetical protein